MLNPAGAALLCSVQEALALLDDGMRTAAAAAAGSSLQLRVSVLPSFAQRWMLPRMARWRARHPELTLEMETSQQVVDLLRDGFHAALRFGRGPGRGRIRTAIRCAAAAHRAGIPETARALPDHTPETLAGQPCWASAMSGNTGSTRPGCAFR